MTYRYIFLFLHTLNGMFEARKRRVVARLGGGEERRWIVRSMGALMSRSFKMSNDVYTAMVARGFTGRIRTYTSYRMRRADWLALSGACLLTRADRSNGDVASLTAAGSAVTRSFDCAASATCTPASQLALDGIDLDLHSGEQVACSAPTGRASRRCSSCWTGSWRRPKVSCVRSDRTSRRSPPVPVPSSSIARSAWCFRIRTSSCSAPPSSTTSPSARCSLA